MAFPTWVGAPRNARWRSRYIGRDRQVVAELLLLEDSHSYLVGLLYWVGFRRAEVPYVRLPRQHASSGWTFAKKRRYLMDSIFSFTDLPLSMLSPSLPHFMPQSLT